MNQKSRQPKLTELIGRIRRSPVDAAFAVNWVKHFAEKPLLKQVIDWLAKSPHTKLLFGDNPFPKEYADIHSTAPRLKCSQDWASELRWNLVVLQKFKLQLNKYVKLRSSFGCHLILGNYKAAEKELVEIEDKISKSLWSLDKRLLLLQYSGGFTANKEYLGQLHNACQNPYINLLALFFSIRVESAIDLISYQHIVETKLAEISKHGDHFTAAYLKSILLADSTLDKTYAAYILFRSNDASIIDRLNATTRFLRQLMLIPDGAKYLAPFRSYIYDLAIATGEPSLLAINSTLDHSSTLVLPEDYGTFLSALDYYTEGKYEDAIPLLRSFIQTHPAAFTPYVVCAKAHAYLGREPEPLNDPFSIASQVLDSFTYIMIGKGDVRERVNKILGLAVDLGENHLAFGLTHFVLDLLGRPDGETEALIGLSSKFPNLVGDSKNPLPAGRLEYLLTIFPDSATLKFLDCRARRTLTSKANNLQVSDARLAFYSVIEQIELGDDPNKCIQILEHLYTSAESRAQTSFVEIRQIALALFDAYIGAKQYMQACEFATRAYMRSEALADSFDLTRLVQSLNPSENDHQGGIYLPIITFLNGGTDFAIHKALDRFLRFNSCKKVSDILKLSDSFPSVAFVLLVGEVMSLDVISLAWRYTNDLADVEAQRVQLCAFLVSAQYRKSKEYAEEAKAIIKRQSIRRALQHVSASKLRIDFTRMKQFYVKTYQTIYDRRRMFVNAEKEGKLVQIETDQLIRAAIETGSAQLEEGEIRPRIITELIQESQNLLYMLIDQCFQLFLWDADGNLNFLLSAEVRHGFLKNHLRKPFQSHNVILGKTSAEGEYRSSDYWQKQLEGNVPQGSLLAIENEFRKFSNTIDELIHTLNSKVVQIKLSSLERARFESLGMGERIKGSEDGYFDYTTFYSAMLSKINELDSTASFDAFADLCFEELERLTENNLACLRDHFKNEVPQIIRNACDQLVEGMRKHVDKPYIWTTMLTAVQDARDEAITEANEIASWFQPEYEGQPSDSNLYEIADIVSTLLRSCHPKALGVCSITCGPGGEDVSIAGKSFSAVFDALYILLQNVAEHAEIPPSDVDCEINLSIESGRAVIQVTNNVCDEPMAKTKKELALCSLNGKKTPSVEGEGRSGLRKINRILSNVVGALAPELHVSHTGRKLSVKLVLPKDCTLV